jgi:hypothetical protein
MKNYWPWLLLTLFCFLVSLSKPIVHGLEPPALVFPLQQLREYGRALSLVAVVALTYATLKTEVQFLNTSTSRPFLYLWIVQGVIFLKNFLFGDYQIALITFVSYTLLIWVMKRGVMVWIYRDGFEAANLSLLMVGVIFVLLNTYQALSNTAPLTVINGQFSGTTNNPQMAAITLTVLIPCLLFKLESKASSKLGKIFFGMTLLAVLYFVWWTASRTGLVMAVAGIIFFYRFRQGALFRTAAIIGLVAAIILPYFSPTMFSGDSGGLTMLGKLQTAGDTRTPVWIGLLDQFYENPLFGQLLTGDRIGFGENSWLSVAANTGLIGLLPLLLFTYQCLKLVGKLFRIGRQNPTHLFQCSTLISGIMTVLVGSLFESILVGVLTAPLSALLVFLLLGDYIIDESHRLA